MSDASWASQLAEAISSLTDLSQLVTFPSMCDKVLEVASKQGLASAESRTQLKQLLTPLPRWRDSTPPDFATAFAQLQDLYGFGPPPLSDDVITALLGVFPTYSDHRADWLAFAFGTQRLAIVNELLDRDFISEGEVVRHAEEDPIAFCRSRLPEAISPTSKVWQAPKVLDALCTEAAAATSTEDVARLVKSVIYGYAAGTSRKTDSRIAAFLSSAPTRVVARFLDETFRRPREGVRLATFLQAMRCDKKVRSRREIGNRIAKLLAERALEVIEAGSSPGAETAGLALASLQLAVVEDAATRLSTEPSESLLTPAHKTRLLKSIASHAIAKAPSGKTLALVTGYDVAASLRGLPAAGKEVAPLPAAGGAAGGQAAVSSAHEAGMRKILSDFARLTTMANDPQERDEALRNILFNHGVREFGKAGEELAFDSAVHETRDSGVFPGDPVRIVRPGQEISAAGARHILVKATVALIPIAST